MWVRFVMTMSLALVCSASAADQAWTGAVDLDWSQAGNWSGATVPGTGDAALLTNTASAFTVSVANTPAAAVGALTVSNVNASSYTTTLSLTNAVFAVQSGKILVGANGLLDIRNGGVMSYWGEASNVPFLDVRDGGEIRVNGGGLLLTNLFSATGSANRFCYLGNQSAGTIRVGDGGAFVMGPPSVGSSNIVIQLGYNNGGKGLLNMSGNSVFLMPPVYRSTSLYVGNGTGASGTVSLADSAKCVVSNLARFGAASATGIVSMAGNSLFRVYGTGQYGFGMGSKAYGELTISDNAWFDGSGGADQQLYFGQGGGTARLTVYGGSLWAQNFFHIGFNASGYLTITNGFVYVMGQYDRGLTLGVATDSGNVAYGNTKISGGTLTIWDTPGAYAVEAYTGLQIGKVVTRSVTTTSRVLSEMVQSGGVITNRAYLFVGQGMNATGIVVQTGGTVVQGVGTVGERVFIGSFGGYGYYALSNGTFTALKDVYVGGYPDAMWPPTTYGSEATNHWNVYALFYTNKVSTGMLRLSGGTFTASNATIRVGGQGTGTLVVGQNATCVAKNITLDTNTSSTVRFEFGANGIGTLQATNMLTICAGAKLEVDASAYQSAVAWTRLIDCKVRTGEFAEADITVIGEGVVRQDRDEDVWLYRARGTLLSIF